MPQPTNIDDLFRQQLDGHATPPSDELWARLHQPPAADDDDNAVDTLFRAGLGDYASQPRREVWGRLEDEHLRPQPRRRRVVAWWQLSAAAVLLLMLLAGGLLWRGSYLSGTGRNVAHLGTGETRSQAGQRASTTTEQPTTPQPTTQAPDLATTTTPSTTAPKKNQEIFSPRATAPTASTSSTPIATTTRPRRTATAHRASSGPQPQGSQPDAAAGTLARHGGRKTPTGQHSITPTQTLTPVLTPAPHDHVAPALAVATPPVAPAAAPEIIEVEVRRGNARPAPAVVADATPAPARRPRLRLGSLLRQADHLVHGEAISLAEATGLPESMTVQARLGGRVVSRTIQL